MNTPLLKTKITPLLKKHGVRRAALFGSSIEKHNKPNDIDILIELDRRVSLLGLVNLKRRLEEILHYKVDLVEYGSLKPSLEKDILKTQERLF